MKLNEIFNTAHHNKYSFQPSSHNMNPDDFNQLLIHTKAQVIQKLRPLVLLSKINDMSSEEFYDKLDEIRKWGIDKIVSQLGSKESYEFIEKIIDNYLDKEF